MSLGLKDSDGSSTVAGSFHKERQHVHFLMSNDRQKPKGMLGDFHITSISIFCGCLITLAVHFFIGGNLYQTMLDLDCLIDWIVFYAVSAMFQQCNSGLDLDEPKLNKCIKNTLIRKEYKMQ